MTLDELRRFDTSSAWLRLSGKAQAAIGEWSLAWLAACLVAEDGTAGNSLSDLKEAQQMSEVALDGLEENIELNLRAICPQLPWVPE